MVKIKSPNKGLFITCQYSLKIYDENSNILEDKDIQKLIEVFLTREEFNEKISNLADKEDINNILTAVDGYAKKVDTYA